MIIRLMTMILVLVTLALPAQAHVVTAQDNGFVVSQSYAVKAAPETVYRLLIHPNLWWNSDHTWSGDAKNLSLTAQAGGCFCEALKEGGSVSHMTVVYVAPNQTLRLRGALGPLQMTGSSGSMTIELRPTATGTDISMTYTVGGFMDGGFQKIAPLVDNVLTQQFSNLVRVAQA